jgi:hypothetical protein
MGPWTKLTYLGEEIKTLTEIFKKYSINIAYSTNNASEIIA